MPYVTTEVEFDLSDLDEMDLVEEMCERGMTVLGDSWIILDKLHTAYRLKQTDQIDILLRELFYEGLGRLA